MRVLGDPVRYPNGTNYAVEWLKDHTERFGYIDIPDDWVLNHWVGKYVPPSENAAILASRGPFVPGNFFVCQFLAGKLSVTNRKR